MCRSGAVGNRAYLVAIDAAMKRGHLQAGQDSPSTGVL
jgi:hypothetical protein